MNKTILAIIPIIALLLAGIAQAAIPLYAQAGYWPLNNTPKDFNTIGIQRNLTINGASWFQNITLDNKYSLNINGTQNVDYADASLNLSVPEGFNNNGSSSTLCAVVSTKSQAGINKYIIGAEGDGGVDRILFGLATTNQLSAAFHGSGFTSSGYTLKNNTLYHVCVVDDVAGQKMYFYVNGTMVGTGGNNQNSTNRMNGWNIGARAGQGNWNGTIREVRWFPLLNLSGSNITDVYTTDFYIAPAADTTPPSFSNGPPGNIVITQGTAVKVQYNMSDAGGVGYFSINDTVNFQINATGYFTNKTALNVSVYTINITINDTSNNKNWSIFTITVNSAGGGSSDWIPACVSDRTCCMDVTGSVNVLCFSNKTWESTTGYDPFASWVFDSGVETYTPLHSTHVFGADFHTGNPNTLQNSKGSAWPSMQFRSYGTISGLYAGGGSVYDFYQNDYKIMGVSKTENADNENEQEGFTYNESVFGYNAVKCVDADNCDSTSTSNTDGIMRQWTTSGNVTLVNGSIYGCPGAFVIWENTSYAATAYDPAIQVTWVRAISPYPTNFTITPTLTSMYWNLAQNALMNMTYTVTRAPYTTDVGMICNVSAYRSMEERVFNQTKTFFGAFNYPNVTGEANKTDYYKGVYTWYTSNLPCVNKTDTNNQFYVGGRCVVYNTPNLAGYYGMWDWDSGNTGLGLISSINWSSPNALYVANITAADWVRAFAHNQPRGGNATINRAVFQFSNESGTQSEGIHALLALNLYNKSVINSKELCLDLLPVYKNDFEARMYADTDNDGRVGDNAGNLGRDGTDAIYTQQESPDATFWHILDSITMANIYATCGNVTLINNTLARFNKTVTAYEGFYRSSAYKYGAYWTYNSSNVPGSWYNINLARAFNASDIAASPFAQVGALPWGLVNQSRANYLTYDILENLYTDSSNGDKVGYTSIPRMHQCYTAAGVDGACDSGETWDGPSWAGVDNFYVGMLIRDAIQRYNYNLSGMLDTIRARNFYIFGIDSNSTGDATPYGAESYNSANRGAWNAVTWGSTPYGWGGNIPTSLVNNYNIFGVLSFNPISGNISYPGGGENPFVNSTNTSWEQRFNSINNFYNSGKGVLHWDVKDSSYGDEPNFVHSYLNMYETYRNESYLNMAEYHLNNITGRFNSWNLETGAFRIGNIEEMYARFSYLAQYSSNGSMKNRSIYYVSFMENNISPLISNNYSTWIYNSTRVGGLIDGNNVSNGQVKPLNQQIGYMIANMYLYNLTGKTFYYNRTVQMMRMQIIAFSYSACYYDGLKICHDNPYRFNYSQTWEVYTDLWGFPPHSEEINSYGGQELEGYYRLWKHGFMDTARMEYIANSIYQNMYVQEGGLTNVLINNNYNSAGLTYGDYHSFFETHGTYPLSYYKNFTVSIGNIMLSVLNYTFNYAETANDTYSFYNYPYGTITDPRDMQTSTYTSNDKGLLTPDLLMYSISTYLYNSSVRESFNYAGEPPYVPPNYNLSLSGAAWSSASVTLNGTNSFSVSVSYNASVGSLSRVWMEYSLPNGSKYNYTLTNYTPSLFNRSFAIITNGTYSGIAYANLSTGEGASSSLVSFAASYVGTPGVAGRCSEGFRMVIFALQMVFLLVLIVLAYILVTTGTIDVSNPASIIFWLIGLIVGIAGFNIISSLIAGLC
jgi:hypothetical protein